ncbi:MAG TPA: hypothetical protein VJT78_06475 [Candidatus Dormibacteraeota bacterium]|nr:hypothetical protein [Candidatus Dormibacteraeota bacterium]
MLVLLTACTQGGSAARTPSPHSSIDVSAAASQPRSSNASPPIVPSVVSAAGGSGLNCLLPIRWLLDSGPHDGLFQAGFISFPSLRVVPDSSVPLNSLFYDRAFSRWLQVGRSQVSPDGRRYAYTEGTITDNKMSKVHVVDIATGADRVIATSRSFDAVVDFGAQGIYLTLAELDAYAVGLWRLDPAGGTPRLISSTILDPSVGGGAAWGLGFNPADPTPQHQGAILNSQNRVLRYDLSTGKPTPWFYRSGAWVSVWGFDGAGRPIVGVDLQVAELWVLSSSTRATRIFQSTREFTVPVPDRFAAIDKQGVWLDATVDLGLSSVWLYRAGSLQNVATFNKWVEVAGGCIP